MNSNATSKIVSPNSGFRLALILKYGKMFHMSDKQKAKGVDVRFLGDSL